MGPDPVGVLGGGRQNTQPVGYFLKKNVFVCFPFFGMYALLLFPETQMSEEPVGKIFCFLKSADLYFEKSVRKVSEKPSIIDINFYC